MNAINLIDADAFEAMVRASLSRLGMSEADVSVVYSARWPMRADAVVDTIHGRGWSLTADDLTRYLRETFRAGADHDVSALTAEGMSWLPVGVQNALTWAVANGVGSPAELTATPPMITVDSMLTRLRSTDLPTRVLAGAHLGTSIGAGYAAAGETTEDFDLLLRPQLGALITAAMEGNAAAVDELERLMATDPAAAFRRDGSAQPSHTERRCQNS